MKTQSTNVLILVREMKVRHFKLLIVLDTFFKGEAQMSNTHGFAKDILKNESRIHNMLDFASVS